MALVTNPQGLSSPLHEILFFAKSGYNLVGGAEELSEVSNALSQLSILMLIAYVLCLFILSQLLFLPRVFVFVVLSFCFLFNSMPSHDRQH